jgi:glucose/arabinose dehydrogenase
MKRALILLIFASLACGQLTTPTPATQQVAPATQEITPSPTDSVPPPTTEISTPTNAPVIAASFPHANAYQWAEVVSGLTRPVDIQNAGDGSNRLFIVEQAGRIRVIENGQLLDKPFLDITNQVGSSGNEQGLLGLAFSPQPQQKVFFVNYTDKNGNTVISRFSWEDNNADPASEKQLLHVKQPFPNHNGGVLAFGPDGYLYAGLGDGGKAGDPFDNGQNTNTLLGKILRLDVSDLNSPNGYTIPSDNPFGNEIWAYGLRNPWRMSFDRATGDLWIGDVGQNKWEEIDYLPFGTKGGTNFGWSVIEGTHPYKGEAQSGIILPVAEYSHTQGGCSVTGGYVYRGSMPEWQGIYLYADFCRGTVWGLIKSGEGWQTQVLFETGFQISTFGVDESGEIHFADLNGTIYRLAKK